MWRHWIGCGLVACLLGLWMAEQAAAAKLARPGTLHRIDLKAEHPRAYHPTFGDQIQCYLTFPVVPEEIVDDLQVEIEGKSVALVAVVQTSDAKKVGVGQISVFLVPRARGLSRLRVSPVIGGKPGKPFELRFLVAVAKAN